MTETEIKHEIGELFRKNDRLLMENERLKNTDRVDKALMNVGVRSIVDSSTYYSSVAVRRTNNGELQVESYDSWVSSRNIEIPDSISRNELMNRIEPLLKDVYEQKRAKAITDFEAGEADE